MTRTPDPSIARTVVRLEVDSYKRLRAATLEPSPTGLVLVRGENGAGKSSAIEAMLEVLGVERAALPITEGEHGASVVAYLGDDLIVRKRWTRDAAGKAKAALTIEGADGGKIASPAAVLETLRGHIADPVAFLSEKPDAQVKTVLGVLGLTAELERLEGLAATQYERRRDSGRDADRLTKAAAELSAEVRGIPAPKVSGTVDALAGALQSAKDHNARLEAAVARRAATERRGKDLAARITALEAQLVQLRADRDAAKAEWVEANTAATAADMIDVAPILEALRDHEEASRFAGRVEQANRLEHEAAAARAEHDAAEKALEGARGAISELLGSVTFPIPGMAYDHEAKVLTIGGIPFQQASQGERLKAAAAIAMAGNPSIRVLFAREGSLIDKRGQAQLAEIAAANGFQLWLEVVDSEREGAGIWVEDGVAHTSD